LDVLQDPLPQIENIDTLIYCPGSINLKPIGSLSIEDFRNDFEINVIGAVKTIQKYLPVKKKGTDPSIVLFSTVAVKLNAFSCQYCYSKSRYRRISQIVRAELASVVRINAIVPRLLKPHFQQVF
jgi:NAD(P)-dependent dehydrogenase (short-subunit alcohol dehydrogenase family)